MFLEDKVTVGVGVETTPGTALTLNNTHYNIRAAGINYDHTVNEYLRKYASGDHSNFKSIMGKQLSNFSLYVDLADGTNITTANPVIKLLNACGTKDTVISTTGNRIDPYTPFDVKPITIELVERDEGESPDQLVMTFAGCMGNCRLVLQETGEPLRYEFEMQGKLQGIARRTFANIIAPSFISTEPTRVLSAVITRGAIVQNIDTFTLDFGNEIGVKGDSAHATGVGHAYIIKRVPKLTINPYLMNLNVDPAYTEWLAGTTGAFSFQVGNFTITVPVAQYVGLKPVIRNGARAYDKTFLCVRNSQAGDDEWRILQGA